MSQVINVDLDGVVYDFKGFMANWFIERGVMDEFFDWQETTWNFWEDWGVPYGLYEREFRTALSDGNLWKTGDAIPGASEYLWRLHDDGYYIRIVTRRLVHSGLHSRAISNTSCWLDTARIPYWEIVFLGPNDRKGVFQADYAIDDNPNYVLDQNAAGITTFLFEQSHNRNTPWQRVKTWEEFYNRIKDMDGGRTTGPRLPFDEGQAGTFSPLFKRPLSTG